MRILICDEDLSQCEETRDHLENLGFKTEICQDGAQALDWIMARFYDAVLLETKIRDADGLALLQELRARGNMTPIIILSASSTPEQRIRGLNIGADDYVGKPYNPEELAARLRAVARRAKTGVASILEVGGITLNRLSREVFRDDRKIVLSTKEFELLELFVMHPGQPFSRAQLLEYVWKDELDPDSNVVDVTLGRLRQKIRTSHRRKRSQIETVRGVGYRMRPDDAKAKKQASS